MTRLGPSLESHLDCKLIKIAINQGAAIRDDQHKIRVLYVCIYFSTYIRLYALTSYNIKLIIFNNQSHLTVGWGRAPLNNSNICLASFRRQLTKSCDLFVIRLEKWMMMKKSVQ